MTADGLEKDIKTLIVESLNLEGIEPGEIGTDEELFVNGLGLDSIDALELGVALQRTYGITVSPQDEKLQDHFSSVRRLAAFVRTQRQAPEPQ